jgi:hypothetical protein
MPHRDRLRARIARSAAALAFVLASLATLGFPGCEDDLSSSGTVNPTAMTMSNCWPNDDGRFWNYDGRAATLVAETFEFVPPGETPRQVSLADAQQLLRDSVTIMGEENRAGYGLVFDGEMTTESGVTAQRLDEFFYDPPVLAAAARAPDVQGRLLARVAEARPDLRGRIAAFAPGLAPTTTRPILFMPYFIHGYAWRKAPTFIGTYGDVDTLLAWKFLDSSVRPGHEFEHPLVPSLAADIWLRALVEREVKVTVPGGQTAIGLDVVYLIDYGIGQSVDAMGNIVGSFRQFDYGRVTYVPGVGPVKDLERRLAVATTGLTHGYFQIRFDLVETGVHAIRRPSLAAR